MHPDVPYPENGWHGLVLHLRQHVRAGDGRQPPPRDARGPRPRGGRGPPDDRDRASGPTSSCRRRPGTRRPTSPPPRSTRSSSSSRPRSTPVGESRSELWMWREIVRRIDPAKARRVLRDGRGGRHRGDPGGGRRPGRPDGGHHPRRCSRPGPVRLPVARPGHPVPRRRSRPRPFPPRVAARAARGDGGLHPDPAHRVLQGGGAVPRAGRDRADVPAAVRRRRSTTRRRARWRCSRRTASGGSTPPTPTTRGWRRSTAGGPRCSSRPQDATARGIDDRRPDRGLQHPRARWSPGRTSPTSEQPGSVTLYEGWWPRQFAHGQGRQRADLVGGQPDPRGPLRRQHVGPVAPAGRTAGARSAKVGEA